MFELQKKQVLDRGGQASQCRRHKPPVSFRSKLCLISLLLHGSPWWFKQLRIRPQLGRPGFDPWVGKIPWRREQLPTPVFLPGEFHERGGLATVRGFTRVGRD